MGEHACPSGTDGRSRSLAPLRGPRAHRDSRLRRSGLLLADPDVHMHTYAAAIGLGVIGLTGVVERLVVHERWLKLEEALSCIAAVFIVGVGGGQVTAITLLWLVAAAVGVLARGGRVGGAGRVLVLGALFSPLFLHGTMSAENLGLAVGSIALLLATGRISRETGELLRQARYDADHDALTGLLARDAFRAARGCTRAARRPATTRRA